MTDELNARAETLDERAARLGLEYAALSEIWCDWSGRGKPYGASDGEAGTPK